MKDFKRVFLDTAPVVYFLDGNSQFHDRTKTIFHDIFQRDCEILTSAVTCAEYLVIPFRENNEENIRAFWQFIRLCDINICHIDVEIAETAAKIRAIHRSIKAFDSMQLSSACVNGCDLFLTNDKQLRQFTEIDCVTLEEWGNDAVSRQVQAP